MRTIGNILWFVLAGWWLALYYVLCGLLAFVLIVTIPFGIAAFRLAGYALWPFGRTVVTAALQTDIARWAPTRRMKVVRGGHWLPRNDPGVAAELVREQTRQVAGWGT